MKIPNILEAIYAPLKAFKKIAEHPTIIAPVLVIVIYLLANVGYFYISASKVSLEQTVPAGIQDSEWTQNSTLWTSNAQISQSDDFVNGTTYLLSEYYGNSSLAFSLNNNSQILMELQGIGTVNCTNPDGYYKLSFRLKWTSPSMTPSNVTVRLFSANSSGNYYKSLTSDFAGSTVDTWNNETIQLASADWSSTDPTLLDWGSITGLRMEFTWPESVNATVLVDGVYFHGPFISGLDLYGTGYLFNGALSGVLQFTLTWIVLSGLIYLLAKFLGGTTLVWRIVLIATGSVLITLFVLAIINAAGASMISSVRYPFELTAGFKGEAAADTAYNTITSELQIPNIIWESGLIIIHIWTTLLCAVVVRVFAGFTWTKSLLVGAMAYVVNLLVGSLLFGIPIF